jgi:hypothetical protein
MVACHALQGFPGCITASGWIGGDAEGVPEKNRLNLRTTKFFSQQ